MKIKSCVFFAIGLSISSCTAYKNYTLNDEPVRSADRSVKVYFSTGKKTSGKKLENQVVQAIDSAKCQILIEAFDLTNDAICNALLDAKRRHSACVDKPLDIELLVDRRNLKEEKAISWLCSLKKHHIKVLIDDEGKIAHSKIMIIDSKLTITGSFNFTEGANVNVENLVLIENSDIAQDYIENWWNRKENSWRLDKDECQ